MNYYLLSCLKLKNNLSALFLSDHHQHIVISDNHLDLWIDTVIEQKLIVFDN